MAYIDPLTKNRGVKTGICSDKIRKGTIRGSVAALFCPDIVPRSEKRPESKLAWRGVGMEEIIKRYRLEGRRVVRGVERERFRSNHRMHIRKSDLRPPDFFSLRGSVSVGVWEFHIWHVGGGDIRWLARLGDEHRSMSRGWFSEMMTGGQYRDVIRVMYEAYNWVKGRREAIKAGGEPLHPREEFMMEGEDGEKEMDLGVLDGLKEEVVGLDWIIVE